jgi:dihydroorotate dehydrogenase
MGSNLGKDQAQVSIVTKVVKEVANVPVWAKLTPSTTDIVVEIPDWNKNYAKELDH